MSVGTIAATPSRLASAKPIGIAGLVLAVLTWFITLPPALVRTPVPSIILGLGAMVAGAIALQGGERRLGYIDLTLAVLAIAGAIAATKSGIGHLDTVFVWSALVAAMLRYATPLLFAALGGIICERSGVINIGLEGMMLMGCFFGICGSDVLGSWVLGLLVAVAAGGLLALVHAFFSIHLRANQVVSGTGINFLALGITGYFFTAHYGPNGTPNNISQVPNIKLPLIGHLGFFGQAIGDANLMTWLGLLLVPAAHRVPVPDSLGPAPARRRREAARRRHRRTAGAAHPLHGRGRLGHVRRARRRLPVGRLRRLLQPEHDRGPRVHRARRGHLRAAGGPAGALVATLLFGFSSALADRLPTFSGTLATLFQALPYLLTLIAVAGLIGRSRPPAASGIPYVKE